MSKHNLVSNRYTNNQTVIYKTDWPGNDHNAKISVLKCGKCGFRYGANGTDVWHRKCPNCKDGKPCSRPECPAVADGDNGDCCECRQLMMNDPHQRHRKFNTRDTYPNQNLDNDLCQVVVARGTLVFVRGQVGQEIEGFASIKDASPGAQADQAMRNVAQLLEEVGSCVEHICRVQIYITNRAHRDEVYQAIGKWLKGVHPVSTGLIVNGLARPEWVMEIEATAVIPED